MELTEFQTLTLWLQAAGAFVQLAAVIVVAWGVVSMRAATAARGRRQEDNHKQFMEALRQRDEADKRRHDESMTALRALIERTADAPADGAVA